MSLHVVNVRYDEYLTGEDAGPSQRAGLKCRGLCPQLQTHPPDATPAAGLPCWSPSTCPQPAVLRRHPQHRPAPALIGAPRGLSPPASRWPPRATGAAPPRPRTPRRPPQRGCFLQYHTVVPPPREPLRLLPWQQAGAGICRWGEEGFPLRTSGHKLCR